jgi:hypothetical protein
MSEEARRKTEDLLLSGLSHDDATVRMSARLLATGLTEALDNWMMEELKRGNSYNLITTAMAAALYAKVAHAVALPLCLVPSAQDRRMIEAAITKHLTKLFEKSTATGIKAANDSPS